MIEMQIISWSLESKFTVGFQEKQAKRFLDDEISESVLKDTVYLGYGDCMLKGQIDPLIISITGHGYELCPSVEVVCGYSYNPTRCFSSPLDRTIKW